MKTRPGKQKLELERLGPKVENRPLHPSQKSHIRQEVRTELAHAHAMKPVHRSLEDPFVAHLTEAEVETETQIWGRQANHGKQVIWTEIRTALHREEHIEQWHMQNASMRWLPHHTPTTSGEWEQNQALAATKTRSTNLLKD
jgi:hypothetical protein